MQVWIRKLRKMVTVDSKVSPAGRVFEQPLAVGMEGEMAEFSAKYEMPIALDESLNGSNGSGGWIQKSGQDFCHQTECFRSTEFLKHCLSKSALVAFCLLLETGIGLATCLVSRSTLNGNPSHSDSIPKLFFRMITVQTNHLQYFLCLK